MTGRQAITAIAWIVAVGWMLMHPALDAALSAAINGATIHLLG